MIAKGSKSVSITEVMQRVGESELLSHYLGITKVPCVINSPLRRDKNPSFSLYYGNGFKVYYHDFSTKEHGSVYDLLMKKFNLDFYGLMQKIDSDFNDRRQGVPKITVERIKKHIRTHLDVTIREWRDYDIEFWNKYGISKEWLEFGKVYPISDIFYKKEEKTYLLPADKYAYVFVEFKDDCQTLKIYQPYSERYKWINDHNSSVWDLWNQLPKRGDYLIITSSRKDALCLWANLGIPACCMQSENTLPKKHIMRQLKDRFKTIFILYDNDFSKETNTGQTNAINLSVQYGLVNLCIDSKYECKDPSDFFKKYGKTKFIEYFRKLCIVTL